MTRQTDEQVAARMIDFINTMNLLEGRFTEAVGHLRGLSLNDILTTEVAVLDADGRWTRDWNVPFGSLGIANLGSSTVTVTAQSAQGEAPPRGVGQAKVRAGIGQVVNLAGRAATLYGAAGDTINVTVFTKPQPPAWGQALPSVAEDTPGTFGDGTQITAVGAATLLLAANTDRRLAIVQSLASNTGYARLGLAGVTTTTGFESLAPGSTARIQSRQALYAIRESTASVTLLCSEVT